MGRRQEEDYRPRPRRADLGRDAADRCCHRIDSPALASIFPGTTFSTFRRYCWTPQGAGALSTGRPRSRLWILPWQPSIGVSWRHWNVFFFQVLKDHALEEGPPSIPVTFPVCDANIKVVSVDVMYRGLMQPVLRASRAEPLVLFESFVSHVSPKVVPIIFSLFPKEENGISMNEHHRYYFDGRCSNLSENISARSVPKSDGHQEGTQGGPSPDRSRDVVPGSSAIVVKELFETKLQACNKCLTTLICRATSG